MVMATLNDICELIVDCPHSTAVDEGTGIPLIRTPNIGKGRFILDGVHRVSETVYHQRCSRAVPQDDDIIFAREAPAGNAAIIKNGLKVCLGQRTVLIRPDIAKTNPDYLVYYLLAPAQQYKLLGSANGSTVAHVNLPIIREMDVSNMPPLHVQRRVANVLSTYDDLIENNRKQIKLLEEAAQRIYKEWFVDLHFPGYETTPIINGIPDGWKEKTLGELIEFNPKYTVPKAGQKRVFPMASLSTSSMVLDFSESSYSNSVSGARFSNDDTLLARITPCLENGKTAYVDGLQDGEIALGSTEFIVMRSKKLNPYMVYLLARSSDFRKTAINSMTGSDGRQRAQVDKLKLFQYLCPSQRILDTFECLAKPMFEQIYNLNKQISGLIESRDRLLPKLMNGENEV